MSTANNRTKGFLLQLDRRAFLKTSGAVAGCAAASRFVAAERAAALDTDDSVSDKLENGAGVNIKYSVCLMCHSACGFKARVDASSGVLLKVDGNPYHPNCAEEDRRLPFATDTATAAASQAGTLCPKGNAMIETVYNPNRITSPLRRRGPRGSGHWEAITWDEALDEIAERLAPYAQRVDSAGNYVGKFLDPHGNWIDSDDYGLGPIANQVVLSHGRIEHGQKEFTDRFWKTGFGTVNYRGDHTSICETSHHVAGNLLGVNGSGSTSKHLKPDIAHCEYLVWFGSNPAEASFPTQTLGKKIARRIAEARDNADETFEMVVVDPRFSNSAKLANKWVPVKPGGDTALAMGIARHMVDHDGFNVTFLQAANQPAAAGPGGFTDATWLVYTSGPKARSYVDAADIGGAEGNRVAVVSDTLTEVEPFGGAAVVGTLQPGVQTVGGEQAKTVFELLVERLRERSVAGWAAEAGVSPDDVAEVATKFAAAGTRAVANGYRGPCQHTNGTHATLAWHMLNTLAGNYDLRGGHIKGGGHLHEMGGKAAGQLSLKSIAGEGYAKARSAAGVPMDRMKKDYFAHKDAYPAYARFEPERPKRPWFPFANNGNYQEILAGIADGYPYPVAALITYWNDWAYSTPAGKEVALAALRDEGRVPFFVAVDVEFGETSSLADIILPECTFLERWSTPHVAPTVLTPTSGFRQPVVGTVAENGEYTTIFGTTPSSSSGPRNIEDILIDLGQRIQTKVRALGTTPEHTNYVFPGIGAGAWDTSGLSGFRSDLNRAYDWYANILQNFAVEAGGGVTAQQIEERGGWFGDVTEDYDADGNPKKKFGGYLWKLYQEVLATSKDCMTGEHYDGFPNQVPVRDALGKVVEDDDFPLMLITFKDIFHSMARTAVNETLMALQPENPIWVSASDARTYGIRTGDPIRIWSRSNPEGERGRAWVTQRIRPGVIGIPHSYGHWEMGSRAHFVDGNATGEYAWRGAGTAMNPLCRIDESVGNVGLQDPIGGSSSFFDTRVRIERVS